MSPPSVPPHGFAHGVDLFNRREFFECHEAIEAEWMHQRGPRRWFLQSVIHLAVGFYHHQCGNAVGRDRQLDKGLKKLAGYLPRCEGVDTWTLYHQTIAWRECGGEFPRIAMLRMDSEGVVLR